MSHTVNVHIMDPGVEVSFAEPDTNGRAGVVIEDRSRNVHITIAVEAATERGIFADARALSENLFDIALALRLLAKDQDKVREAVAA